MSEVILRDRKERPLVIISKNQKVIFQRYVDLSEEEKSNIVKLFENVKQKIDMKQTANDVRDFLDFKTEDICA